MKAQLEVVGAVIIRDGLILCARRGPDGNQAGLWEFPGGKVEARETPAQALVREIGEELGCQINVGDQIAESRHEYDSAVVRLTTFASTLVSGTPVAHEHSDLRWLTPEQLPTLEWAPADVETVQLLAARHA
jgi:8-oxo-dGTP diphosphatase